MAKADSVLSTPPTNTSALDQPMMFPPRDPTRRRFLAVAAVASVVSADTLAAATAMDQSVLQAVTVPQASRALRDAIRALDRAHTSLIAAQADNEEAEAIWMDWQRSHPQPRSNRATRKWIKKGAAYHQRVTAPSWQALMCAELVFATAQCEVALVPITGPADLHGMAVASAKYDRVELARGNRSPIGLMVATEIALGSAVQS
jgi:hypothetical protein